MEKSFKMGSDSSVLLNKVGFVIFVFSSAATADIVGECWAEIRPL